MASEWRAIFTFGTEIYYFGGGAFDWLFFAKKMRRRRGQREKQDLLEELRQLPENAVVRRINELVKRARSVKVHAYIIHYLRKQMPYMMGKQDKQVCVVSVTYECVGAYFVPYASLPARAVRLSSHFFLLESSCPPTPFAVFACTPTIKWE